MLFGACSSSLSTLSSLLLAFFNSLSFNLSLLLGSCALDCGNTLLSFSLDSKLGILLSFESGGFLSLLITLLLLFLFLEHMFELLDGTSVLLCKLLEFGSLLLLLLLLLSLLIFLILTHQLSHELIGPFAGIIKKSHAVLNDFLGSCVFKLLADGQSGVTLRVASKDLNFGVLDDVLEHLLVGAVLGSQVHDGVVGAFFAHKLVCIFAKEYFNHINVRVRTNNGQLQRCQVVHFRLEGASLGCNPVSSLDRFDIEEAYINFLKQIIKHLVVAMVGSRTNDITCHRVLSALAQADMANFV